MDNMISKWVLYFFLYCVVGWIWEVLYVSARKRTWVNRGFLYGPWLPIYGFGAVMILLATLPVRGNLPLVFLFGMIGATALEYITGVAMERIFHMRYWDYSENFGNVNGHICVMASASWGVASVLVTEFVHPPVERLVSKIPGAVLEGMDVVLVAAFTVDVVRSVEAALNLKELLASMTENSQFLQNIEEWMEQVVKHLKLEEKLAQYRDKESSLVLRLEKNTALLLEEIAISMQQTTGEEEMERLGNFREMLLSFRETLQRVKNNKAMRREKDYQRAASLLKRNPSAVSKRYPKALVELKEWKERRKKEK